MKITATKLEKAQNKSFSRSNKSQNREETGKGEEERESWRREKKPVIYTPQWGQANS